MAASKPNNENQAYHDEDDDDEETPQLSLWVALFTLGASTVLVAICAEFMVSSIDAVSEHISKTFVGLILLPIVGNAAEHATAVTVAIKDKMDLAIGVAVGSSMQIALLVLPLAVILGWILGKDDMVSSSRCTAIDPKPTDTCADFILRYFPDRSPFHFHPSSQLSDCRWQISLVGRYSIDDPLYLNCTCFLVCHFLRFNRASLTCNRFYG